MMKSPYEPPPGKGFALPDTPKGRADESARPFGGTDS